ncbi:MAG TPA: hypothetical protein VLI04_08140 [Nocardioidaceae bacterium]|nr:hypothetical protein [Nocardioidaceae bacterium]
MRAKVVTTITSELDLDSMEQSHSVDIDDCDGLSEVSRDVLGALVIGALQATERTARSTFPGAGRAADRLDGES